MTLLTLPPWIKEGQAVEPDHSVKTHSMWLRSHTWTIARVRSENTFRDSMVRVECKDDVGYESWWVALDVFLHHWRRAAAGEVQQ